MLIQELLELEEEVAIPFDVTITDVLKMFDAAKRAVGLMNKLKDPNERKKHASAIFKNMNKIRAMIMKLTDPVYESVSDQEVFEAAKKPIPKMGVPGVKVVMPQTWRSKLQEAIKSLGYSIEMAGYEDGSTSWAVAFYINKKFDIEKFENDLRDKLSYDQWMKVSYFDLEEK